MVFIKIKNLSALKRNITALNFFLQQIKTYDKLFAKFSNYL